MGHDNASWYGYDKTDTDGNIFMETTDVVRDTIFTNGYEFKETTDELRYEYIFWCHYDTI